MRYIVLVDTLPRDFEEGCYRRINESNFIHSATSKLPNAVTVAKIATVPILAVPAFLKGKTESRVINKINEIEESVISSATDFLYKENYNSFYKTEENIKDWELGGIILSNENLKGNYSLEPKSLFNVLLDCVPNFSSDTFKKLMQSGGGSELIIVERNKVPRSFQLFAESGMFDTGIYIPHPKLPNKLIPLKNSTELIKEIILGEMITVLTLLGAKRIVIKEAIGKKNNAALSYKGSTVKSESESNSKTLRASEYLESTMDIERARKCRLFTADMPRFETIFKAREYGNQIYEKFEETVDFSLGVEASVMKSLNAASFSGSVNLKRSWSMEIEFHDKNRLEKISTNTKSKWLKKLF